MTPYQRHVAIWKNCDRCPLCERRQRVVFVRGHLPCDVLMVGEAPGPSENVIGRPFVGPAGHLLDQIVSRAAGGPSLKMAFTNLVGCIPLDENSDKFLEPPPESIAKCAPKLRELVTMADPKLIVWVGKLAGKHGPKSLGRTERKSVEIMHPAAILRANVAGQGLMIQKCVVILSDALEGLV